MTADPQVAAPLTAPADLPPDAAIAFFAMGAATTREKAQEWADEAKKAGATDDDLAVGWRHWERRQAERQIVIDHDGVYDGMPEEQYHGHRESLSSSGARKLLPPSCPALFAWERDNGRPPKRTFDYGHAAHQKVLGVGAELVVVQKTAKDGTLTPADDYRTKSAQDHRDDIRAAGKVPILAEELEQVDAMADAILQHPIASVLFDPDRGGKPEQSLFWTDPAFGVLRRARLDWLPEQLTASGRLVVPDYKTTVSAEKRAVAKSVAAYGYAQQDDWYRELVLALGLADDVAFVFVFQEKTPPYLVNVVEIDGPSQRVAHELNQRALGVYADCTATGVWPGYSDDIELVGLPPYVLREFGELA